MKTKFCVKKDVMEAIFDMAYLIFDLVAAILFFIFSQGNMLFILYGVLTLTLCGGDAFHLVPRIIRAVHGSNDKIKRQLGIGLQVSSITMTVFYIILMYIWKFTFPELKMPAIIEAIIWISAVVRIVICMFPQNNWCTDEGNMKLSIIRNAVFAVTGIGVIILYIISEIKKALLLSKGNKSQAAKLLGVDRTILYDKMKKYEIQ